MDNMITGGGDGLMFFGFIHRYGPIMHKLSPNWQKSVYAWGNKAAAATGLKVGYMRSDILHMWHGTRAKRDYMGRWAWLYEHDYTPSQDVEVDDSGLWRWSRHAQRHKGAMIRKVADYFKNRDEDEHTLMQTDYPKNNFDIELK